MYLRGMNPSVLMLRNGDAEEIDLLGLEGFFPSLALFYLSLGYSSKVA